MEFKTTTHAPEETQELGRKLGRLLAGGITLALIGDLGSGKTCFAKGLARGLDVPERYVITSPTFTLVNEYPGRVPFYHVDLYRLAAAEELEEIGIDEVITGEGVAAIEWAERLPEGTLVRQIRIEFEMAGADSRTLSFSAREDEIRKILEQFKSAS